MNEWAHVVYSDSDSDLWGSNAAFFISLAYLGYRIEVEFYPTFLRLWSEG